jgi:hypothetical protein
MYRGFADRHNLLFGSVAGATAASDGSNEDLQSKELDKDAILSHC